MTVTNWITRTPKINLFSMFFILIIIATGISNFKLDASSETLLLENDPDLKLYRENTELYGSSDFLVVTFTPNETLISKSVITDIKTLVSDLSQIKGISSVLSLLDVPLSSDDLLKLEYIEGISCHNCKNEKTEDDRQRFAERQKQNLIKKINDSY